MKILSIRTVALPLLTLVATFSVPADEVLGFCDQQLITASISCSDSKNLENCIASALENTDCRTEVANKDNVELCNESCTPDIKIDFISNSSLVM